MRCILKFRINSWLAVFSTMGIPACLWRRTGEIFKGNREFAELVGVPYEQLRDGKLAIYEFMTEDSAVNFWEVRSIKPVEG